MRKLLDERPLTENGNGAQIYFDPEFVQQHPFPLDPGEPCTPVVVPHKAVVLLPGTNPELPLEVTARHPDSYQLTAIDNTTD